MPRHSPSRAGGAAWRIQNLVDPAHPGKTSYPVRGADTRRDRGLGKGKEILRRWAGAVDGVFTLDAPSVRGVAVDWGCQVRFCQVSVVSGEVKWVG